jgi:uncharacterized membrane protein YjjP (DUF1212 family)
MYLNMMIKHIMHGISSVAITKAQGGSGGFALRTSIAGVIGGTIERGISIAHDSSKPFYEG